MAILNTRITSSGTYFVNGTFDEVTGVITTNGLVASFDAGRLSSNAFTGGTTWTDPISNYKSTLSNVTYSSTGGGSIYFSNNSAQVATLYSLTGTFWSSSSWTVSIWTNLSFLQSQKSGAGDNAFLSHGLLGADQGLHLGERGGVAYFGFYSDDFGGSQQLTTGTWYNIVYQYNNITKFKSIYINGRLDASGAASGFYTATNASTELGRYTWSTSQVLYGYLGQVAIYNQILPHRDILKNYQTTLSRYSNTGTNVQTRITPGTTYYNQYDEVTYNPNNGVVSNNLFGYSQDFISGWSGSNSTNTRVLGRAPDGTTGYMRLVEATTSSNKETSQGTATLSTNTAYTISVYAQGAGRNQFRFGLNSNFFSASTNAYFDLTGTGVVSLIQGGFTSATIYSVGGGWYRCAATFIPNVFTTTGFTSYLTLSSGTNTGYFGDGISGMNYWGPQLERNSTATIYVATTASAVKLTSFVQRTDAQGTAYVSNYFDEVTGIVNTNGLTLYLDANRPASIYSTATNKWIDLSNTADTAILNTTTFISTGLNYFNFNGTNSFVYTNAYYSSLPTTFSIGAWFSTTVSGKVMGFENTQAVAGGNYDRQIYVGTDGKCYFGVYPGITVVTSSTNTITDGKWHYAVGTLSSTSTQSNMTLYIDGAIVAINSCSGAQTYGGYLKIGGQIVGGWINSGNPFFNGSIGAVQLYNRPLSSAEVADNFNSMRTTYGV